MRSFWQDRCEATLGSGILVQTLPVHRLNRGALNLLTESAHGGYLDYFFNYFEFLRSCEFGK